jgi:hypothetical protein
MIAPLKALFKALEADEPPKKSQAAATPELLRAMISRYGNDPGVKGHTADLIVGAFFFAMRACEFCWTQGPRKTKRITLNDVTFRDKNKKEIKHNTQ